MDVAFLKALYDRPGPYASVYLSTDRASATAAHMIDLRWRELRGQLEEQGADSETLAAVDAVVGSDRGMASPHGQAIFAAGGEVLLREELSSPNITDRATFAGVPDVLPLLVQYPDIPAHILVLVDRKGADIEVHTPVGVRERQEVNGADHPLTKVSSGEWNQSRYQRRAENTWDANLRGVAERVERTAASNHAAMIAASGDVRARTMLLEHLAPVWRPHAISLDGAGRGEGDDRERTRRAAAVAAAQVEEFERARITEQFERWLVDGGAVQGVAPVVEQLRSGMVDTLLLRYGASEMEAPLWWGPEPGQLALHPEEMTDVRAQQARRDRAGDVMVRELVRMGGQLLVLAQGEPGPDGAVGALLRSR